MCFLALLHRVVPDYPVVVAANRDEYRDRPGTAPRALAEGIWGGQDPRAGGTWLGVNRHGLVVGVTNITRPAGRADPTAASRGLLCKAALACPSAAEALDLSADQVTRRPYNAFNLLAADARAAEVGSWTAGQWTRRAVEGLFVLANGPAGEDDPKVRRGQERIGRYGDLAAAWAALPEVLADTGVRPDGRDAICIDARRHGTLSASLLAVSDRPGCPWRYAFCPASPAKAKARWEDRSALLAGLGPA